jgi:hypothetical protein
MSTLPAKQTPEVPAEEPLEQRFRRLEAAWLAEVGYSSSGTELRNHPAFQEIIGLGEAVVPLMPRDLEERPRLWGWALPSGARHAFALPDLPTRQGLPDRGASCSPPAPA